MKINNLHVVINIYCRSYFVAFCTTLLSEIVHMHVHSYMYISPCPYRKLCSIVVVDTIKSHDLVLSWQRESWWMYGGALSSELDRERYREAVCHALNKYFNEDPMVGV